MRHGFVYVGSAVLWASAACSGGGHGSGTTPAANNGPDPEVCAWAPAGECQLADFTKMNKAPYFAKTHGKRFVDVWVNTTGLAAYKDESATLPVGSVIVKTSYERKDGKPTDARGPIFVMIKKEAGFNEKGGDWWYAIHWAKPTGSFAADGPIDWKTPEKKVGYCSGCHDGYDRQLGMVPEDARAW